MSPKAVPTGRHTSSTPEFTEKRLNFICLIFVSLCFAHFHLVTQLYIATCVPNPGEGLIRWV